MILWVVQNVKYKIKINGKYKSCDVEGVWSQASEGDSNSSDVMVMLRDPKGVVWHTTLVELMLWNENFKPLIVNYEYIKIWKHYDIPAITTSQDTQTKVTNIFRIISINLEENQ